MLSFPRGRHEMASPSGKDLREMKRSFHPGYQLAWLGICGLRAGGALLPLPFLQAFGGLLGRIAGLVARRDIKRAREHLKTAFPELDAAPIEALIRRMMIHLGKTAAETLWLLRASPQAVDALCEIRGREHLVKALEKGRGAVLITGHLGNWELLNARLGTAGIPMSIAVRDLDDPRIDALADSLRARFGSEVIHRGRVAGGRLINALKRNRVNGLLIDQDIRDIPGVHVPFFGRTALTPIGAAQLALKMGSPVIPAFIHRQEDNHHLAEVFPPLEIPASGSFDERVFQLTARATAAIEAQIRRHPSQWVWMHRRWRTRPA